jgi:hypothetical protein
MALRWRPMQPRDVRECVAMIAAHPVIGPRYGSTINDLPAAWLRLLRCEAKTAAVFHAGEDPRAPSCFVGVSVFVNDDFLREIKAPPGFWFGPELARRIVRGKSPVLSDRQLREANSTGGLNLLVWEGCIRPEFADHAEIQRSIMGAFIDAHRGFLWKELIGSQMETVERLEWTLYTGGLLWNYRLGSYMESPNEDLKEIIKKPHVIGVTRETESKRLSSWSGSWVGILFDYRPPRLGFSPAEQRLLLSALSGESGTDEELAGPLGVSLSTVKKMWLSIYRRVADCMPELIPGSFGAQSGASERGKEKKRHLLAYLREHPEELRPVSRKLLRQTPHV